jgi:hypothetical protein
MNKITSFYASQTFVSAGGRHVVENAHQFRVLGNASSRFIHSGCTDYFDRENVSGFELSTAPLEVLADVPIR